MAAATQPSDPCTYHGEGPVLLRWVDQLAGDVLSAPVSAAGLGTPSRLRVGSVAAAVRPRRAVHRSASDGQLDAIVTVPAALRDRYELGIPRRVDGRLTTAHVHSREAP